MGRQLNGLPWGKIMVAIIVLNLIYFLTQL